MGTNDAELSFYRQKSKGDLHPCNRAGVLQASLFLIPKMMSIFTLQNCLLLKRIAAYLLLWLEDSLQMN